MKIVGHAIGGTLWVKALWVLLVVLIGMTERVAVLAVILPLVVYWIYVQIRNGLHEEVIQPKDEQDDRIVVDVVYGNGVWINEHRHQNYGLGCDHRGFTCCDECCTREYETPTEGIERLRRDLLGDRKVKQDAQGVRTTPRRNLRAVVAAARVHTRGVRELTPTTYTPHELSTTRRFG